MGYFISLWGRKTVAYVDEKRVVMEPVVASHIERCLGVYGLKVNMGVDEEVSAGGYVLTGYKVEVLKPDASEGYIVKSIEVCLGLIGIKAEKEPVGKIYELKVKKDISGVEKESGGEKPDENHGEEIGFEPA